MSDEFLVTNSDDPRIDAAALGVRPYISDSKHLQDDKYKFAASNASYRVQKDGSGTFIYLYGTDEAGHSAAVRVENFRPYLYVSLAEIDAHSKLPKVRDRLVRNLIDELQSRLLVGCASMRQNWAPERLAMRSSVAGSVWRKKGGRSRRDGGTQDGSDEACLLEGRNDCLPIVDWRITQGLPVKGSGQGAGYRGMRDVRFLQIFFYAPSFVSKCRSLLHGKNAELGALAQAEKLGRGRSRTTNEETAATGEPVDRFENARQWKKAGRGVAGDLKMFYPEPETFKRVGPDAEDEADVGLGGGEGDAARALDANGDEEELDELTRVRRREHGDLEVAEALRALDEDDVDQAPMDADDARYERDHGRHVDLEALASRALDDATETSEEGGGDYDLGGGNRGRAGAKLRGEDAHADGRRRAPRLLESEWYSIDRGDDNCAQLKALEWRLERRFERRARRRLVRVDKRTRMLNTQTFSVYEADLDFTLRLAVDCGFSFEHWVNIDTRSFITEAPDGTRLKHPARVRRVLEHDRETRAQVELRTDYRALSYDADDPIQNTLPAHVILSLDCEMSPGPNMEFPDPTKDRMLQCVCIVRDDAAAKERGAPAGGSDAFWFRSASFILGESIDVRSDPRPNCTQRDVFAFKSEALLFRALARYVRLLGATVVTGYNTDGFDLPYMIARSEALGVGAEFTRSWGRSKSSPALRISERTFESSGAGKIVFQDVSAQGVSFIDLYLKFRKDPQVKLRSLSLNFVAAHYLGEQKEDVSYATINPLQESASGRETLRLYCEKDALLPLQMFASQMIMPGMIEMSRINVCSMEQQLKRGQTVRAFCCMLREMKELEPRHYMYTRTEQERASVAHETFDGAVVIDPNPGLYETPTNTLDFASLYPSIIGTHNLCFSTYVAPDYDLTKDPDIMGCADPVAELTLEERVRRAAAAVFRPASMTCAEPYAEEPAEDAPCFLKQIHKVGIVVLLIFKLLARRKGVKVEMRDAYDSGNSALGDLLNKRQLAVKLLCNSLYGIFGSPCAFSYCRPVSSSVTCRGRALLYQSRWIAMRDFPEHRPKITYGDTDSIFVHLPLCNSIQEAAQIGLRMAAHITRILKETYTTESPEFNILDLEFEKTFERILLIAKKRYAGLKYEYSGKDNSLTAKPAEGVPTMSGLESNKRDVILLVKENVIHVLSLLLDPKHSTEENMTRARDFIWHRMVRPVLDNTIDLRLLVNTKKLNDAPSGYIAKNPGVDPPIHVQLAAKLAERAGGEDHPNAPKAGERVPFVVLKGEPGQKVSARGEDPVYAFEHNLPIDSVHYLERLRSPLLRFFVPIMQGRTRQRQLVAHKNEPGERHTTQFGLNDAERTRNNEAEAAEFLFGHRTEYVDRAGHGRDIVPVTMLIERQKREKKIANGVTGIPPVRDSEGNLLRIVRYRVSLDADKHAKRFDKASRASTESSAKNKPKVGAQRGLGSFVKAGARCKICQTFKAGVGVGYVCDVCSVTSERARASSLASVHHYAQDIEDLRSERAALVETCQTCAGRSDAPRYITCTNGDCPVFWQRKSNEKARDEVRRRTRTALDSSYASGALQRKDFNALRRKRVTIEVEY